MHSRRSRKRGENGGGYIFRPFEIFIETFYNAMILTILSLQQRFIDCDGGREIGRGSLLCVRFSEEIR